MLLRMEFIKPSLLEAGEEHRLNFMLVHPCGRMEPQSDTTFSMTCSDPEIVEVNGSAITGLKPGETEIAVDFLDDRFSEFKWKVLVRPAGQPAKLKLKDRPRMLFSIDELADFRDRIKRDDGSSARAIDASVLWAGYLAKADDYVEEDSFEVLYPSISDQWKVAMPLTEPKRVREPQGHTFFPFWTMYARAIEDRLVVMSTAFLVTEERKYAVRVKQHLLSLAAFGKWYEFDERGAEGNLSNAHLLLGASCAYDAIHSLLTEEERRSIRQAILDKGLHPLAIDIGSRDMHNIVAAKQVAMVYGAAAIMDENPFAAKYLQAGLTYLQSYLDRKGMSEKQRGCCTTMWLRAMPGWRRIFIGESAAMTAWLSIRICGKSFLNVFSAPGTGKGKLVSESVGFVLQARYRLPHGHDSYPLRPSGSGLVPAQACCNASRIASLFTERDLTCKSNGAVREARFRSIPERRLGRPAVGMGR